MHFWICLQDAVMDSLQFRARVDAELCCQCASRSQVDGKRRGLLAGLAEGEHEHAVESLPKRLGGQERQ